MAKRKGKKGKAQPRMPGQPENFTFNVETNMGQLTLHACVRCACVSACVLHMPASVPVAVPVLQ